MSDRPAEKVKFELSENEREHEWECANCGLTVRCTASDIQCGFRFECPYCGGNVTGWADEITEGEP